MSLDSFSIFDAVVIGIIAISALVGLLRGITKEVLSIAGWVGAAFAAYAAYPYVKPFARTYIESTLIADIAAAVGVFVIVLIVLSVCSNVIAFRIRNSALGPVDRSLGVAFGLARGALVVCGGYLVLTLVAGHGDKPAYLTNGQTRPLVEEGATYLHSLVPMLAHIKSEPPKREPPASEAGNPKMPPANEAAAPRQADTAPETGYKTDQIQDMDQLIRGAGKPK